MAVDMSTVKEIKLPGPLYKKKIYLTNSSIVYKGTSTSCPVEVTLYSKTQLATTITSGNLYDYLTSCGYTASGSRYRITVDNPYEFTHKNGTYDCVCASLHVLTTGVYVFFSGPRGTETSVSSGWTITEDPWQKVGSYQSFIYEYKSYIDSTGGIYINLTVGKNYITGDEYIANYCINGVSYPDVTIVMINGNTYTLSDRQTLVTTDYSSNFGNLEKEVIKIEDHLSNIIWRKPTIYRRLEYIKFNGAEYINTAKSITTSDINQRVVEFKIHVKYNNITDWGVMGYDTSSGNTRFNLGVNGSGYSRFGVANVGTWQDSDGFLLDTNTTYFAVVGYNANNSKKGYYWNEQKGIKNISTNTLSATGNLYIGAVNYDGSPSSYSNCLIYQAEIAVGSADNYVAMMIPCQRKSDNKCGLYDTIRQQFLPMNGTSTTTDAAGPITEEYWDPTS